MVERRQNQIDCEHEWEVVTNDQRNGPGIVECKRCQLWLTHANRLQLEMNRYTLKFQKKISIVTIILSVIALVVSVAVAIWK